MIVAKAAGNADKDRAEEQRTKTFALRPGLRIKANKMAVTLATSEERLDRFLSFFTHQHAWSSHAFPAASVKVLDRTQVELKT